MSVMDRQLPVANDPKRSLHALGLVRCSDVFALKPSAPMRSSAARAAHRG